MKIEEHYYAVNMVFRGQFFRFLLLTQSEYFGHYQLRFSPGSAISHFTESAESLLSASGVLSKRLATLDELFVSVTLDQKDNFWENNILWRRFYQQFPSVKTLRTEYTNSAYYIARTLHRDLIDLAFLHALEEIDLGEKS
jgi:hypothetical protein